jgi:uncharacterized protein (TIRG00374 family)
VTGHAALSSLTAGQRRSVLVGLVLGIPLSAVFLVLALRNVDLAEVEEALRGSRLPLLLAAVAAMACVYVLQATRWRLIAATPGVPLARMTEMVVGGVACNNVLPGRLGDLFRARWLGKAARIPGGRALATVVLDRGADVLTLVVFLVASLLFVADASWVRWIVVGGIVLLICLAALLLFARSYTSSRSRGRRQGRSRLRRIVRDLVEGLAEPLGRRRAAAVALLSLGAWGSWAVAAWLVARSVGVELSPAEALFTTAVLNLGVAIPSSPGFIGTYQWLAVSALGLFGIAREDALAFSILMHAVWYVPTTFAGGVMLLAGAVRRLRRPRAHPSARS